jgi:hypothetical protein
MNKPETMVKFRLWILAWFLISLGVATAAPMVQPRTLEVVCSTAGSLKVFVHTPDGTEPLGATALDCPLCLVGGAPPYAPIALPLAIPVATALPPFHPAPRAIVATAASPPARAPPFFPSQS